MQLDIADVLLSRSLQADMGGRLSVSSMSSSVVHVVVAGLSRYGVFCRRELKVPGVFINPNTIVLGKKYLLPFLAILT